MAGMLALQPAGAQSPDFGKQHQGQRWPQASLQAQASVEVQHDTVKIILATEINGDTQAAVAQALNTALEAAMKDAKKNPKVKASSGNYRIWPMNDRDGKLSDWRGRGEILLESSDFTAASEVATLLSDRVSIANLMFSVSPQARARQEQLLLEQAAQTFRDRAQSLAQALGYSSYTLKEVNLSGAGAQYQPAPRMMMASMDAAAKSSVPVEGGTEEVSVSIQGSIFLQHAQK
ncbi:SIMPL domain-containing protein [Alcaligenaceae bacterium]|nr:SIMPL domain-containing protein [Alcaligenaceae bacterium]